MTCRNIQHQRFPRVTFAAWVLALATFAPKADADDPGWPRSFERNSQRVIMRQPQIDDWEHHEKISFRSAIAVTESPGAAPIYGILTVKAKTRVNFESRTVLMTDLEPDVRFADKVGKEQGRLERVVRHVMPSEEWLEVSLDRVIAYRTDSDVQKRRQVAVNVDPPQIFYSSKPSILLMFVGKPQFKPIKGTSLHFAVNTNWDVFFDKADSRYYLLNGQSWLTSTDPINQPWTPARVLPASLFKLPDDANWRDVRKNIPGKAAGTLPTVYVSTGPAELIHTDGEPRFATIPNTRLLHVTNTTDPIFMHTGDQNFYYLAAGRWFRTRSLTGPWSAAGNDLPGDFALIPMTGGHWRPSTRPFPAN